MTSVGGALLVGASGGGARETAICSVRTRGGSGGSGTDRTNAITTQWSAIDATMAVRVRTASMMPRVGPGEA